MKRALAAASLIMKPEGYADGLLPSIKPLDGSGDFTFTRGSNLAATRVNSDGLIEKGRENLLKYSADLTQSQWQNVRTTDSTGHTGYDGTANAFKIIPTTENNTHRLDYVDTWTTGFVYTFSFYAKADGYTTIDVVIGGTSVNNDYGRFDLSTGTATNSNTITASMEAVGGGWYRCQTAQISGSTTRINIGVNNGTTKSYAGDGTSGVLIQHPQFEAGLVATDYIETGATTATAGLLENTPRIDYSSGAGALLLEPQRTNKITNSEYINTTTFNYSSLVTINNNHATSPDGFKNAAKITADASSGYHQLRTSIATANGYDIVSCFVKASGYNYVQLASWATPANYVNFDLTDGSIGSVGSTPPTNYDIEDYGNGWYRIHANVQASGGGMIGIGIVTSASAGWAESFTGNGTDGLLIWGVQLEDASYPTSYIPTYGASVTRSYDDCDLLDLVSKDIITDATEWTIMFEVDGFSTEYNSADGQWFAGQDGTLDVYMRPNGTNDAYAKFYWRKDGKYIGGTLGKKIIARLSGGTGTTFVDGVLEASGSITGDYSSIGFNKSSNPSAAGYVKQILVFPTALTDSECIALTTL
jgi:hypothetical protein